MIYGVEQTVYYTAWNTATNAAVASDQANHTLSWVKDGSAASPTNSPSNIANGVYALVITATEAQCLTGKVIGSSSTASVVIIGETYSFHRLPNAAPGSNGGLPTVDGSNYVAGVQGTLNTLDALDTAQDSQHATTHGKVDVVDGIVDAILADTGTDGVVVAAASKTGYTLASDGLDSVSTTAPSGVAANFREMVVQTWRRFFKRGTMTSTEMKTYADDNATVLTTQTLSDNGTTQEQGPAS